MSKASCEILKCQIFISATGKENIKKYSLKQMNYFATQKASGKYQTKRETESSWL